MLVAQILCTNAFYKQVQQERSGNNQPTYDNEQTIIMMQKMINALTKEVENLKKNL